MKIFKITLFFLQVLSVLFHQPETRPKKASFRSIRKNIHKTPAKWNNTHNIHKGLIKQTPIIQNETVSNTPICLNLFPVNTGIALSGVVGNLLNTPINYSTIWGIIWLNIQRRITAPQITPFLKLGTGFVTLDLGQRFGVSPSVFDHIEPISNDDVDYTLTQAIFSGDPLVSRDVCRIKITDPALTAIIYDIFTVYNGNTPEWFFCNELSINFFITPDDAVNYGLDNKKFHFEIRFENDCVDNGPIPLATEVYKIENLDWDSIPITI